MITVAQKPIRRRWKPEYVDFLKDLWARPGNPSAKIVAERINRNFGTRYSRSAILSKIATEGMQGRRALGINPSWAKSKRSRYSTPCVADCEGVSPINHITVEASTFYGNPIGILELTEETCRWPIGDPATEDFKFCGAHPVTGKPYCHDHTRIAYAPIEDQL